MGYYLLCTFSYVDTWHEDIMAWKPFLHYWPFVMGIHWSAVDSPHKWPVMWSHCVFFVQSVACLLPIYYMKQWVIHVSWTFRNKYQWNFCHIHLFWYGIIYSLLSHMLTHGIRTSWPGKIFCITGPLWWESTGDQWIFLTKASNVEIWYFLCCWP